MSEQDYTIDDVARILQVQRKTVERLILSGKLEAYKVGRVYRIKPEALERYRTENKVIPPEQQDDLLDKVAC